MEQANEIGSVEVVFAWRDATGERAVIEVEAVDAGRPALWVGTGGGSVLPLPADLARTFGDSERFCMVERRDHGATLHVPPGASAIVSRNGLVERLEAGTLPLVDGMQVEVSLGAFSYFVRPTRGAAEVIDRGPLFDTRAARWGLVAFAAHAAFVGMFFFVPPRASALTLDLTGRDARYIQATMLAIEEEQAILEPSSGDAGQPTREPDSSAGAGNETEEVHIAGGPGRREGASRRSATPSPTPVNADNVRSIGMLAALTGGIADMAGNSAFAFGNPDMLDGPGGPGYQHLVGGPGGPGFGGIDMQNAGRGTCLGAHCGDGTVASGGPQTSGDVGPRGRGVELRGDRTPRVPGRLRELAADATGALSREQIRRTVHRHINEVRFCYTQALQARPDLGGRVSVRFMISADGVVANASIASESGSLGSVGSCVAGAVRRWTFPAAGSPTIVTYPFLLEAVD